MLTLPTPSGPNSLQARRAVAEVAAMVERVAEVERMMRRREFPQVRLGRRYCLGKTRITRLMAYLVE